MVDLILKRNYQYLLFILSKGLSEDIRQNFAIMKELAVHTRMGPEPRAQQLNSFMAEMKKNPEASSQLTDWNLEFAPRLLNLDGRVFPTEKIYQKDKQVCIIMHFL